MDVYIIFPSIALLMTIFLSLNLYFKSRKNEDIELKTFVQTRRRVQIFWNEAENR
jgi:hypothetical protein